MRHGRSKRQHLTFSCLSNSTDCFSVGDNLSGQAQAILPTLETHSAEEIVVFSALKSSSNDPARDAQESETNLPCRKHILKPFRASAQNHSKSRTDRKRRPKSYLSISTIDLKEYTFETAILLFATVPQLSKRFFAPAQSSAFGNLTERKP